MEPENLLVHFLFPPHFPTTWLRALVVDSIALIVT